MLSDATEPTGALIIRTLAMPADTNPAGDIFGGWVMSQMDIAGAIAAVEQVKGRVVTVAVEAMTFIAPVKVGDVLCVYADIERIGTTSITVGLEAWVRRNRLDERSKVTEARFVYVSLDDTGKKRPIPVQEDGQPVQTVFS
ncbi:acyl-CoA thioesterase YciA [Devosia subaequoris]|uniref:Acyl-CoA thioesterase YciA n=1 Tax=Devosia subaequoris TaxID=395930 RepID=A0A7W6IMS8_9HYPH|nr:acyl-CoA thioesterase [Devosia subaequoris]MBB4051820.1 acyl-CoA thioesterase YciA [Devosia subaequoris]MCP1210978.1 acyl-CoA thioesterase [Devosia subaequoris]